MINREKLSKFIRYWFVPKGIYISAKKIYHRLWVGWKVPQEIKKSRRANVMCRDKHKGERCFILASGPSIKNQDLALIKNEWCISMSMFFLHEQYETIKPHYHVFAPNHSPFDFELTKKYLEGLEKVVSWDQEVFFCHKQYKYSYYNFVRENPNLKPKKSRFIDYTESEEISENNYCKDSAWDISERPFTLRSALYPCIQLAVYMGFDEIYLLGVDHDYLVNLSEDGSSAHFYDYRNGVKDSPFYTSKEKLFYGFYKRWKHYRLMRESLEQKGVRIYNASEGSYLDVFPRVKLSTIL